MKFSRTILFVSCMTLLFSCKNENTAKTKTPEYADTLRNPNPYVSTDQSPMDMAWCPTDYPVQKMKGNDTLPLIARIIYSRPQTKGREIFGESNTSLCPYGKPWRLGANEATELDLVENVSIAGKNIPKGLYVMYCIPHADRWTIILNSNLYTWGLHIKEDKDVFRTDIPVMTQSPRVENFTMAFQQTSTGADLVMAWDNVKTVLPLTYAK
ncbi:MAG: DUF2911 domain-containing protein [Ferruginibacter sp.]